MTKTQEKKKQICIPQCVQEILNKSMPSSLWKDLPPEVLENVLACLPMHVLCRFRLVCKKWNHLFSQPSFAALCALSPRQASSILVSPICNVYYKAMPRSIDWHLIDSTEKRTYKLSDSFIMDSYLSNNSNKGLRNTQWNKGWFKYTLAADGELIYTVYFAFATPTTQMHFVCNPVSKSFYEIPQVPEICSFHHRNIVVMSVDNTTQTYKIITIERYREHLPMFERGSQKLYLYESTTSAWRKLCEAPNAGFLAYSTIFMKGIFYTLFVDVTNISTLPMLYPVVLYSCDLGTGAWSKIEVDFPPVFTLKETRQLVVSLGWLYMVKSINCRERMVKLCIWKIGLETKKVVKVAKFQKNSKLPQKKFYDLSKVSDNPIAMGCADSIIISWNEGCHVKFNLLENHWQQFLDHTLDWDYQYMFDGFQAYLVDF